MFVMVLPRLTAVLPTDLPGSQGGAAAARALGRAGSSQENADPSVLPQEILVTWQETGKKSPPPQQSRGRTQDGKCVG